MPIIVANTFLESFSFRQFVDDCYCENGRRMKPIRSERAAAATAASHRPHGLAGRTLLLQMFGNHASRESAVGGLNQ